MTDAQSSFVFDRPLPEIRELSVSPARATDPETAHEAANADASSRGDQRLAVYRHFLACGARGSTDYETAKALGILRTSAGKRRKELCERNLIVATTERRQTDTSSTAIVWRAVEQETR